MCLGAGLFISFGPGPSSLQHPSPIGVAPAILVWKHLGIILARPSDQEARSPVHHQSFDELEHSVAEQAPWTPRSVAQSVDLLRRSLDECEVAPTPSGV
jgi:hypothetical protein